MTLLNAVHMRYYLVWAKQTNVEYYTVFNNVQTDGLKPLDSKSYINRIKMLSPSDVHGTHIK